VKGFAPGSGSAAPAGAARSTTTRPITRLVWDPPPWCGLRRSCHRGAPTAKLISSGSGAVDRDRCARHNGARRATVSSEGIIRFGSLTARLACDGPPRGEDVARIFGTSLKPPSPDLLASVELEIALADRPRESWPSRPRVPEDGMVLRHAGPRPEIHTEALAARLDLTRSPAHAEVAVLAPDLPPFDLSVHLAVVLHKLLLLMDRVVLHAAAVRLAGRVSVFLGDKGAGKSTVALRLARAGGTVLGEDHLVLKRSARGFRVSGCDERSRVDARTERHFFPEPLAAEPADFAGTLKKEVPAASVFASEPYTDRPADLVFFSRVGTSFRIRPLSRGAALLRLVQAAGRLQRFVDATDHGRFLGMLSAFVPTVSAYQLDLSDDLRQLDRLVGFLQEGRPVP
jgi:hypothetical protein